jgi:penicillin amidase
MCAIELSIYSIKMKSMCARCLYAVFRLMTGFLILLLIGCGWLFYLLHCSLPLLDGTKRLPGLTSSVTIRRDALGVPTILGANRPDIARALGYLHAQDRFFQMDVLRRRAAGELSELFGKSALPSDRAARMHGFRFLAQQVIARTTPEERAIVEAYTEGINSGLAALGKKPFEYYVLHTDPQPWRAEDCALIGYAMMLNLQGRNITYKRTLSTLYDTLGPEALDFFAPLTTPYDAALDGSTGAPLPIPSSKMIDFRRQTRAGHSILGEVGMLHTKTNLDNMDQAELFPGSNAFALSGNYTTTGAALLANDMHLSLSVPNICYRVKLEWPLTANELQGSASTSKLHEMIGVTIPGSPLIIVGSNCHVAWGFTDAYADTGDLVMVAQDCPSGYYRVPPDNRLRKIERRKETIRIKGSKSVDVEYQWTIWGPIVGANIKGELLVYNWTAYNPSAINFGLIGLENAASATEAVDIAHHIGIPAENFIVADSVGNIAWTIAGLLPKRKDYNGRLPVISSALVADGGDGDFLLSEEVPSIIITTHSVSCQANEKSERSGRLWAANNRLVGGSALDLIGDGGYAQPARAMQIRDDLDALIDRYPSPAMPQDLLAIELDDRALHLARWRQLLLDTLTTNDVADKKSRLELRKFVEKWEGHAGIDSVSYRLVRMFHNAVARRVLDPIFAPCIAANPDFAVSSLRCDDALWSLIHTQPPYLLNPKFATWKDLLLAGADDVITDLEKQGVPINRATWGRSNTLRMQHPFGRILPFWLTTWLNMPSDQLSGDIDMPRVQGSSFGASERFVVSPGNESEGIFEMPGGESGHPLSPFYRAGHDAWVHGKPTSFMPGKTAHILILEP